MLNCYENRWYKISHGQDTDYCGSCEDFLHTRIRVFVSDSVNTMLLRTMDDQEGKCLGVIFQTSLSHAVHPVHADDDSGTLDAADDTRFTSFATNYDYD